MLRMHKAILLSKFDSKVPEKLLTINGKHCFAAECYPQQENITVKVQTVYEHFSRMNLVNSGSNLL